MNENEQKQREEYLAGWKRALADYDNLKKDLAREKEESRNYLKEQMAHELIPILDSFDQVNRHTPALNVTEEDALKFQNWLNGVRQTQAQLERVLQQMGLQLVPTNGVFDPTMHEAIGQRSEDGKEDGAILEVVTSGWKLGEKVIRPAKVIINQQ
ncbi:MAG: nucleotide exchange factor GrpE [Patescibacteria group bacterium]